MKLLSYIFIIKLIARSNIFNLFFSIARKLGNYLLILSDSLTRFFSLGRLGDRPSSNKYKSCY